MKCILIRTIHAAAFICLCAQLCGAEAQTGAVKQVAGASMMDRVMATGKTGIVQAVVSIAALAFALERFANLRRRKVVANGIVSSAITLWKENKFADLDVVCQQHPCTFARAVALLATRPGISSSDASTMAGDLCSREMRMHLQKAYPLAIAATISPLLGLFGTVYGMVGAFEAIALTGDMGNAAVLADSISYALMTTVFGLVVAIPSLALYHFFRMKTNILALSLEGHCSELISSAFQRKEASDAR